MPAPKAQDKVEIKNVNLELKKILEDDNSELLFAVTIYKNQVVGSVNAKLNIPEERINEIVEFIVSKFNEQ